MSEKNRRTAKKKSNRHAVRTEQYNSRTLHEDREYGLYWYAWLWKLLRPVLIFLCSLLIVIGVISFGYRTIYDKLLGPVSGADAGMVAFEISSGTSITEVGNNLKRQNLIQNASMFKYMVQLQGLGNKISYGTFELSPSMTVSQVIAELTSGKQTNERTITIVPGWTCEDIADYLVSVGALKNTDEFLVLCNDVERFSGESYALKFAQDIGALNGRKYALEGYLAPDTYRIFRSATAENIITTLLTQHNRVIDSTYYADAQFEVDENGEYRRTEHFQSNLTMDQYITMASMIEKEAVKLEDYPRVSAVFHNRLSRGWRLESDPTATYTFGLTHYILSQDEKDDQNLYNTYVVPALPVGPICNPSVAALSAAIHPDERFIELGVLYFCATDPASGELAFATTPEEHAENVSRYQSMWAEYDAKRAQQ